MADDSKYTSQTSSSLALAPTTATNKLSILLSKVALSSANTLNSYSVPKIVKYVYVYLITI